MKPITQVALRLPVDLAERLSRVAAELGESRNTVMTNLLDQSTRRVDGLSPDLVLGYIHLTDGELDSADCPECEQPMTAVHVGFTAGVYKPQAFGPVCSGCARTD